MTRAASSPAASAEVPWRGSAASQPLDGGNQAGRPRQVVGKEGERLVEERPLARAVVISKVGAQRRKPGALEQRVPLQRFHHVVEARVSFAHDERAGALGLDQEARVRELRDGGVARCGGKGETRPKPVEERPSSGNGQLAPAFQLFQETRPAGGKSLMRAGPPLTAPGLPP